MTVQECKDELPDVKVEQMGKVYDGWVVGRLLPFALVCWRVKNVVHESQFAWETVARAVTNGTSLKILGNG